MALADPQAITVGTTEVSLPRVSTGTNTATYQSQDGLARLTFSHNYAAKRTRRMVKLESNAITPDPLNPTINRASKMAVYIVIDVPSIGGFDVATQQAGIEGFLGLLSATDYALIPKLLGGQS